MNQLYQDRIDAGRRLASLLLHYRDRNDVIVLGLPRGGIPVGYEIAQVLHAPLDAMLVRKLGHPMQPEFAIGAIASGGIRVMNENVESRVDPTTISQVERAEREELLRRQQAYRGTRPFPSLLGKTVILVDDGLATGSTMKAAIHATRVQKPARLVVAVPVAPPNSLDELRALADEVVCPMNPRDFYAIGQFYESFLPTSDERVKRLLDAGRSDDAGRPDDAEYPQTTNRPST